MAGTTLVVPTIRPQALSAFLNAWQAEHAWDQIIIVFDGPANECRLDPARHRFDVLTWDDFERLPKTTRDLFSRKSSAIRSLGMWRAWQDGTEVIFNLDDDCYPATTAGAWVEGHRTNLRALPICASSLPDLRVRGEPLEPVTRLTANCVLSMGLWQGVADCYAFNRDALPRSVDYQPPRGVRATSPHQLVPFSGMNFAVRREFLPALYFPPMGGGQPYHRFDDTWAGLPFQVLAAWQGKTWTVGEPFVQHRQNDGDLTGRKNAEAPGLAVNGPVWRFFAEQLEQRPWNSSLTDAIPELCARMRRSPAPQGMSPDYWRAWAGNLLNWGSLFA